MVHLYSSHVPMHVFWNNIICIKYNIIIQSLFNLSRQNATENVPIV